MTFKLLTEESRDSKVQALSFFHFLCVAMFTNQVKLTAILVNLLLRLLNFLLLEN